jgi:glycosyltransferase involved in cell wall biosynthesis
VPVTDVFVGFVFDDEKEKELMCFSKCGVGTAANQYQQGILSGLSGEMRILTTLSTGAFPRLNRKLFFKKESKTIYGHEHTYLPFVNLFLIRDMMFRRGLYRELSKVVESQQHTKVYVYSLYMPSLKALEKLKKKYGNRVHYCLIIPDLAGKYGLIRRGIKGIKDRLDAQKKMSLANRADSFVFLTEAMKELFDPKPYTVIEGFLPACEFDYSNQRIPKSVLYTGSLNRAFGMQTLLEAFSLIQDPDAQLWICGAGDLENVVKEAAQKDPRIQFKGFLPKNEIAALQTQCDVLINPRTDEGEYTKYSFPSKTMEYLLSGSKVVMHQLPGIGEEYYRFIRVIEDTDAEAMARAIVSACEDKTFYDGRWQEQIRWMLAEKNSKNQLKNIWSNCHED